MGDAQIQRHPGFVAAINVEMAKSWGNLRFEKEVVMRELDRSAYMWLSALWEKLRQLDLLEKETFNCNKGSLVVR